jgi:DNA-binding MarR family transcriptional regulator
MVQAIASQWDMRRVAAGAVLDRRHADAVAGVAELMAALHRSRLLARDGAPGMAILIHLAKCGPVRVTDLAAAMGVDPSTVSRQVSQLAGDGLVDRVVDPGDRRAWLVSATDRGRLRAAEEVRRRVGSVEAVLSGWSDSDVTLFAELVARFAGQFDAQITAGQSTGITHR